MIAVWKRELQSYFLTPIGYVFMGFFLLLSGIFFFLNNMMAGNGSMANIMSTVAFLLLFLTPILTMRLFSEERKNKSDQLLLTSPLSITSIVVGKFLAAFSVLKLTLIVTLFYTVVIFTYGRAYPLEILTVYIGILLMGGAYISIGVLISSMTENQLSAAIATLGVNFALQILEMAIPSMNIPYLTFLPGAFAWLSLQSRFSDFLNGMLSVSNVIYYLSFIAVILFLTVRIIEKRRWSEG